MNKIWCMGSFNLWFLCPKYASFHHPNKPIISFIYLFIFRFLNIKIIQNISKILVSSTAERRNVQAFPNEKIGSSCFENRQPNYPLLGVVLREKATKLPLLEWVGLFGMQEIFPTAHRFSGQS